MVQADARRLPFPRASFDLIFTSPPWDNLGILVEAKPEMERVLKSNGSMALVLPNLDSPLLCSLAITNRDWSERRTYAADAPRTVRGPRYFSMADEFVAKVLTLLRPKRVLDPFCGTATVVRVAHSLGIPAWGADLDRDALACG